MADWRTFIQGKIGDDRYDIPVNLTKGTLGGLAVYLLSKTSRPGTAITIAAATAAIVSVADQKTGHLWTFKHGITPIYRGIQLYASYYALSHVKFTGATASFLEALYSLAPILYSLAPIIEPLCCSSYYHGYNKGRGESAQNKAAPHIWGILTVKDKI